MFVLSLKYNVFPIDFIPRLLRQLFKDFRNRLLSETHFFLGTSEGGGKKRVGASSSERSCYQAAQWLWLSILISVVVCV